MMVHHDEHEALDRGLEGANFFGYSLGHYYVFGEHEPGETDVWQEYIEQRGKKSATRPRSRSRSSEERLGAKDRGRRHHGPARRDRHPRAGPRILAALRGGAASTRSSSCMQAGKNQHEHIMESLELFGSEVLPEFKDRDEEHVAEKTKRLEPVIETAMARKVDERDARRLLVPGDAVKWADSTNSDEMKEWLQKFADDRVPRQERRLARHQRVAHDSQRLSSTLPLSIST